MAFDTVVDKARLEGAMTATADVIRSKTGDTVEITWNPETGFQEAVAAIDINRLAHAVEDGFLLGTYASIDNNRVETIYQNALRNMPGLRTVVVDSAVTIGDYAMYSCTALTKVHAKSVKTLGQGVFYGDAYLTDVDLSAAETIGKTAFYSCRKLAKLSLPAVTSIGDSAFNGCYELTILVIGTADCTLGSGVFTSTPIGNGSGTIYIPSGSYEAFYKDATNWSDVSSPFVEYDDIAEVPL